jgi:hypothetical protein
MIVTANDPGLPRFLQQARFNTSRLKGLGDLPDISIIDRTLQIIDFAGGQDNGSLRNQTSEVRRLYAQCQAIFAKLAAIRGEPEAAAAVLLESGISGSIDRQFQEVIRLGAHPDGFPPTFYLNVHFFPLQGALQTLLYYMWDEYISKVGPAVQAAQNLVDQRIYANNQIRIQEAQKAAETFRADAAEQVTRTAEATVATNKANLVSTQVTKDQVAEQYGLDQTIDYVQAAKIGGVPVMPVVYAIAGLGASIWLWNKYGGKIFKKSAPAAHSMAGYKRRRKARRARHSRRAA